ncbi:glycosyltransferase family 2 protein [Nonomuraea sediminis]|uniref:glycosyltransferase family 2 protein n=1 Tax=Nonomuraea sediminis TaxID=2835864 RepID=UPI001BDBDB7F|nr:glycosyltransferase family 2 protein [Nonomuraea sediminis]
MHRRGTRSAQVVLAGATALLVALAWIITYRLSIGPVQVDWTFGLHSLPTVMLIVVLAAATWPRSFEHLPVAHGRVAVIVPCYQESAEAVLRTIDSLLAGTVVPDRIYIVDDGSTQRLDVTRMPPRIRYDRRIKFFRQQNGGKREAQARALYELRWHRDRGQPLAEYVVTVDSDCELEPRALAELLRAMSDQRVMAATGLPLTRNRTTSWLTRLIDLEISSICLTYRSARSRMGSLTTCSGALAVYRADVVLDNLDDYLDGGAAAGDDRRLTHYALLRGQVVSVPEAIVYTDMPTSLRELYRQRVRWSSSHWNYSMWEIAHLPTGPMLWSAYTLIISIVIPIGLLWVIVIGPILGQGFGWQALGYWLVLSWVSSMGYAVRRPRLAAATRWTTWLLGVPGLMLLQIICIRPAMLAALREVRSTSWHTRELDSLA